MKKRVLVVDDEQDVLESVKMLLANAGYDVTAANSGREALKMMQKNKFDLVLLDILMPGMAGNKVAEKIRKNPKTKNQKIIFLTVVTPGEHGREEIKKLSPADYIQKPFKTDDFKKRIRAALG